MSGAREPLAEPKAIGEDVEELVLDAVDELRSAVDPEDWYDAHVETTIGPRSTAEIAFQSICLLEERTRVEIKSCKLRVSNGARDRPGLWTFQIDQHQQLLADGAVYLLAVYEEGNSKQLDQMLVVPATILDECLAGRWYDVERHEGRVAQLAWPHVFGDQEVSADV